MVGVLGENPIIVVTVLVTYVVILKGHQQQQNITWLALSFSSNKPYISGQ
jgi:hypothetical protein